MKRKLSTKLTLVLLAVLWTVTNTLTAQVAINTTGATADDASLLDVTSTTKGILIPRMTATERDAIASPVRGLLVFVTTDNCFYFYNNSSWVKMLNDDDPDDDWQVFGDRVYVTSPKKVGIGSNAPDAKLTVFTNDGDLNLKIRSTYTGSNTIYASYVDITGASSGNQYGNYLQLNNTGTGIHYGSYTTLSGTGTGKQYGNSISVTNSGDEKHYGTYTSMAGTGNGNQYCLYNSSLNTGAGSHYGTYTSLTGSATGNQYGTYHYVSASGDGTHYGLYNYLSGSGSGKKYGVYTSFYANTGGTHYGLYVNALGAQHYAALLRGKLYVKDNQTAVAEPHNALATIKSTETDTSLFIDVDNSVATNGYGILSKMSGTGTGRQYAIYNHVNNTGDGKHYGVYNELTGTAGGIQFGTHNTINNSGSNRHYGSYNYLTGTGNGKKYGTYVNITSSSGGTHYGNFVLLNSSINENKYGSYLEIPASAGGTHYGVYSLVSGSGNYSGYFSGRVYISDSVGIGVTNPTAKLDVFGDFQVKNSGAPAIANIESDNDAAELTIKSGGPGDDAQIKFYTGGILRSSIGFDIDNDRFFIKEGVKNIFIDNGAMIPETHRTQNLGTSSRAWDNIYYDDLHNMGASAFGGRSPSKEIISYPPKEKTPGSFDYMNKRGDIELDPASVPPGLSEGHSLLTDEMVSYNYKTNYEQQVTINTQQQVIEKQKKQIDKLEKLLLKLENRITALEN
jgi:hypothetical protein